MDCAVDSCTQEARKRGWCYTHYNRWQRYGSPTDEIDETPTADKVRSHLAAGLCPFCGRGPYRVVAGHVRRTHGIDARQLRDLGEIKWSASICDPDHSDLMRNMMIEKDQVAHMLGKHRVGVSNPVSAAGRIAMAKAGETMGERRRIVPVDAYPAIRARSQQGESAASIGRDYGVSSSRIGQIIKSGPTRI